MSAFPLPGTGNAVVAVPAPASGSGNWVGDENFAERTGLATPTTQPGQLTAAGDAPVADVRYLDVVPLPDGGFRLFYEAPLPDGSHELRTELISG